jgi:hypothetical protein
LYYLYRIYAKKCNIKNAKKIATLASEKNILSQEVKTMATFLDLRTSQGNRSGLTVGTTAPDYVAGIGLQVNNATNIRVDLEATVPITSAAATGATSITISIRRYTDPSIINDPAQGVQVYSQAFPITQATSAVFSLSAADITTASATGILAYGLFVLANGTAGSTTYSASGIINLIGNAAGGS